MFSQTTNAREMYTSQISCCHKTKKVTMNKTLNQTKYEKTTAHKVTIKSFGITEDTIRSRVNSRNTRTATT